MVEGLGCRLWESGFFIRTAMRFRPALMSLTSKAREPQSPGSRACCVDLGLGFRA